MSYHKQENENDEGFPKESERVDHHTNDVVQEGIHDMLVAQELIEKEIEFLPQEDKAVYVDGIQNAPDVLHSESFYLNFMRVENYQARPAAERLVSYWSCRKETFGNRAFLPLFDLSGNGAMTSDDINFLKAGLHVQVLDDCEGSPVIVDDISRLSFAPSSPKVCHRRMQFYVHAKVASSNPVAQTKGVVLLRILRDPRNAGFDKNQNAAFFNSFTMTFPIKLKRVHLCCIPPEAAMKHFVNTLIPSHLQHGVKEITSVTRVHLALDGFKILPELLNFGMSTEGLVPAVGGTWSYEEMARSIGQESDSRHCAKDSYSESLKRKEETHACSHRLPAKKRKLLHDPELDSTSSSINMIQNDSLKDEYSDLYQELETLLSLLPDGEKAAYEEAMRLAPHVVQEESHPRMFLEVEGFDCEKAAKRLATYWTRRKTVLGSEDFVKRLLDLTKNGALNMEDKSFIRTGVNVLLQDAEGCTVFCNDLSLLSNAIYKERHHRMRVNFYFLTKIAVENHLNQTKGCVILRIIQSPDYSDFKPENFKRNVLKNIQEVMPLKLKANHICCFIQPGTKKHFVKTMLPRLVQLMGKDLSHLVHVHMVERGKGSFLQKLEKHGFTREELVPVLGGDWSYQKFQSWLDDQMGHKLLSHEVQDVGVAFSNCEGIHSSPGCCPSELCYQPKQGKPPKRKKTLEERKARKREMDVIYARNRRLRCKEEEDELRQKCCDLNQSNMALETDNERLEKMLIEAKAKILRLDSELAMEPSVPVISKGLPPIAAATGMVSSLGACSASMKFDNRNRPEQKDFFLAQATAPPEQQSAVQAALARERLLGDQYLASICKPSISKHVSNPASHFLQSSFPVPARTVFPYEPSHPRLAPLESPNLFHASISGSRNLTTSNSADMLSFYRMFSSADCDSNICQTNWLGSTPGSNLLNQLQERQIEATRNSNFRTGTGDRLQQNSLNVNVFQNDSLPLCLAAMNRGAATIDSTNSRQLLNRSLAVQSHDNDQKYFFGNRIPNASDDESLLVRFLKRGSS